MKVDLRIITLITLAISACSTGLQPQVDAATPHMSSQQTEISIPNTSTAGTVFPSSVPELSSTPAVHLSDDGPIELEGWLQYEDHEIGVAFQYPASHADPDRRWCMPVVRERNDGASILIVFGGQNIFTIEMHRTRSAEEVLADVLANAEADDLITIVSVAENNLLEGEGYTVNYRIGESGRFGAMGFADLDGDRFVRWEADFGAPPCNDPSSGLSDVEILDHFYQTLELRE